MHQQEVAYNEGSGEVTLRISCEDDQRAAGPWYVASIADGEATRIGVVFKTFGGDLAFRLSADHALHTRLFARSLQDVVSAAALVHQAHFAQMVRS